MTKIDEIEIKRAANTFTQQRLYGIILPIINLTTELQTAAAETENGESFEDDISRIVKLVGEIRGIQMP